MAADSRFHDEESTSIYRPTHFRDVSRRARPHLLELVRGPGAPRVLELGRDQLTLGRADGVDLQIDSSELSRHHLKLTELDGEYTCVDLDSRNGVYLNGLKIHSAVLREGDQIQLGDVVLVYHGGT